jgi:hypothetical protein
MLKDRKEKMCKIYLCLFCEKEFSNKNDCIKHLKEEILNRLLNTNSINDKELKDLNITNHINLNNFGLRNPVPDTITREAK